MKKVLKYLIVLLIVGLIYINKDYIEDQINYFISSNIIEEYKSEVLDITIESSTQVVESTSEDEKILKGLSGYNVYVNTDLYIYYTFLNDNEKTLYKQIVENANNYVKSFTPEAVVHQDNLTKVVKAVYYDHPELFFLDNSFSYQYNQNNEVVEVNLVYNETINYIDEAKRNFDSVVDSIVAEAKNYPNALEQEKFVHNKLIEMIDYDLNSKLNQSSYSAFVLKSSVCAGYAKAFQLIMTKLGVPTYYVVGESDGDHAWNIINLGGTYLNVDLTWDDASFNKYKFFNKSDVAFSSDHTRKEESLLLPSCA